MQQICHMFAVWLQGNLYYVVHYGSLQMLQLQVINFWELLKSSLSISWLNQYIYLEFVFIFSLKPHILVFLFFKKLNQKTNLITQLSIIIHSFFIYKLHHKLFYGETFMTFVCNLYVLYQVRQYLFILYRPIFTLTIDMLELAISFCRALKTSLNQTTRQLCPWFSDLKRDNL